MISNQEKRREERIVLEVPVMFENGTGLSRDISKSGIYFMTDLPFEVGGTVNFSVKLDHIRPGRPVKLDCHGQVLRIEPIDGRFGVAATISELWSIH